MNSLSKPEHDRILVQQSIEHWERMMDVPYNQKSPEGPYCDDCPLCERYIFNKGDAVSCEGCPIHARTNRRCRIPEWYNASDAFDAWEKSVSDSGSQEDMEELHERWIDAARIMVNFLKSLL